MLVEDRLGDLGGSGEACGGGAFVPMGRETLDGGFEELFSTGIGFHASRHGAPSPADRRATWYRGGEDEKREAVGGGTGGRTT